MELELVDAKKHFKSVYHHRTDLKLIKQFDKFRDDIINIGGRLANIILEASGVTLKKFA